MEKVWVAVTAMALLATATAGIAQAPDPFAQARIDWNRHQAPFRVIGDIYYVGPAGISVYLIVTPDGDILTDGGLPESADHIEANIKTLGFDIKDVKILLNSHAHFDHAGGLAQLKRDSGAQLLASSADRPYLENGRIDFGPSSVDHFPPVKVDRIINDGDTISLGGVRLTAMITPGHTPGCTNKIMSLTEGGVPHKVMFFCSITTGGNPLIGNSAYPSIAADYKASFARLRKMATDIDVFLAGHGDQMDLAAKLQALKRNSTVNPFIDKGSFSAHLIDMEKRFDDELARQSAAPLGLPPESQSDVQLVASNLPTGTPAESDRRASSVLGRLFTSRLVVDDVPATNFRIDKTGLFTVVLADGEVWSQQGTDGARVHWKGEPGRLIITIRQGSLGTYNLEVRGDSNRYVVRPVGSGS